MTEIAFHFNAQDKWGYACRLLRKAVVKGSRVAVTAEPDVLAEFDRGLWAFSPVDFVPHCAVTGDAGMVSASPVVLCEAPELAPHQEVLLNLGAVVPAGFERFDRLIEVVGADEADRLLSRKRWKYYLDRGYTLKRHDLALKEAH